MGPYEIAIRVRLNRRRNYRLSLTLFVAITGLSYNFVTSTRVLLRFMFFNDAIKTPRAGNRRCYSGFNHAIQCVNGRQRLPPSGV